MEVKKAVTVMSEDTAYIEEELYTEEDWDDMILMAEIELRNPGKEDTDGKTEE